MTRLHIPAPFTAVLAVFFLLLVPSSRLAADLIYAIDGAGKSGSTSNLYTIDSTNGSVVSTIGAITVSGTGGVMLSSIAFDPLNGLLYGAAVISGNGTLVQVDPGTAMATPIGTSLGLSPSGGNVNATGLAFSSAGVLFAYVKQGNQPESLFKVNTSTGTATVVGSSGIPTSPGTSGDGLAMSPSGTLYFAGAGDSGTLYTLNTTSGAASTGPTLTGAPNAGSSGQIKGLAFDNSGTLFGVDIVNASPFNANLVTINPTTGAVTNVHSTKSGIIGLAFQPTATPEPGSLALMGFAAVAMFLHGRRRRTKQDAVVA